MAMRGIGPDLRMPQAMRGIAGEFRRPVVAELLSDAGDSPPCCDAENRSGTARTGCCAVPIHMSYGRLFRSR
jgi:hypothetical protein